MENDYIPIKELKEFCIYRCSARNFSYGIWISGKMFGIRHKFMDEFIDYEIHYDDNGTCKPIQQITDSLKERIVEFNFTNWRNQQILMDILYGFSMIIENEGDK